MPQEARTLDGCRATSKPLTVAFPSVIGRIVMSIEIVVVFPAPFGPRSPKISPLRISRSIWSTATRSPKRFVRPLVAIITPSGEDAESATAMRILRGDSRPLYDDSLPEPPVDPRQNPRSVLSGELGIRPLNCRNV